MLPTQILSTAIETISQHGYVTKHAALITGKISTAEKVVTYLKNGVHPVNEDIAAKTREIENWILGYTGSDRYLLSCKRAVLGAHENPEGLICSLVTAHVAHLASLLGLSKVTAPNAFAFDPGELFNNVECAVVNIEYIANFKRISLVDEAGHLIVYNLNNKKPLSKLIKIGANVLLSGRVLKNKFTTPFETVVSLSAIERSEK